MLIGEFARRLGVTTDTIRFYEKVGFFSDLPRKENGYRVYTEQDMEIGELIASGKSMGFSLREILLFTREMTDGSNHHARIQQSLQAKIDRIDEQMSALKKIRKLVQLQIDRCRDAEAAETRATGVTSLVGGSDAPSSPSCS